MAKLRSLYEVMFLLQHESCYYCKRTLPNKPSSKAGDPGWTRDHVIPRSSGAQKTGNILLVCRACNTKKADSMPSAERIAYAQDLYDRANRIQNEWYKYVRQTPRKQRTKRLYDLIAETL